MKKEENGPKKSEVKHGRRTFFKQMSKYLLGISTFTIASIFGLRRGEKIQLGKMKDTGFGLSEAHGTCGGGLNCSGGGGQCGGGLNCSGGGGQCGGGLNCAGE